ncbi:hypothetical protein WT71_16245 [Burkholderia stagnalis]|nr:hypothetical protein WT71_16245 [Burkholderia stagnalis]KWI70999.1 hypothetical protein WT73_14030 [Burkholderia stagnalis]
MAGPFAVVDLAEDEIRTSPARYRSADSVRLYFENGGQTCFVVSLPTTSVALEQALAALPARIRACPEISLLVWCEVEAGLDAKVYDALGSLLSRGTDNEGYFLLADACREGGGLTIPRTREPVQTAAYYPGVWPSWAPMIRMWVAGLDAASWGASVLSLAAFKRIAAGAPQRQAEGGAVQVSEHTLDAMTSEKARRMLDWMVTERLLDWPAEDVALGQPLRASVAMAGALARVDGERGVWKTPAYVVVRGVTELVEVTTGEVVQIDDALAGNLTKARVNSLRAFDGLGVLTWGARTMAAREDSRWCDVAVRRLCNSAGRTIDSLLHEAEASAGPQWDRTRSAITHYLNQLWRLGALYGDRPDQAYFVAMKADDLGWQNEGATSEWHIQVGLAVERPAEFVLLERLRPARLA